MSSVSQTIRHITLQDALKKQREDRKTELYNNDSKVVIKRMRDNKILFSSLIFILLISSIVILIYVVRNYVHMIFNN